MNPDLQAILDFISRSEHLTAEEKSLLSKAAKNADKDLERTVFKLERTEKVKKTTGILLEETIAELEQKRKAVEEQNRKLELESALEKVRSRSLAMHKSDELKDVVSIVFEKLRELDITMDSACILTFSEVTKDYTAWAANPDLFSVTSARIPFFDNPISNAIHEAREMEDGFLDNTWTFEEKNTHWNYLLEHSDWKTMPEELKKAILKFEGWGFAGPVTKKTATLLVSYSQKLFSERAKQIIKRFGEVFDQAYTRFLDLQKAEAQTRESQIELGLERVRASAMAMHSTDGLFDTAEILYKELSKLGIESSSSGFGLIDEKAKRISFFGINPADGKIFRFASHVPIAESKVMQSLWSEWTNQSTSVIIELNKQETLEHETYMAECALKSLKEYGIEASFTIEDWLANSPKEVKLHFFNFRQGGIYSIREKRLTDVQEEMVARFTKVFQLTYTRFLDLQKAEAQAREARIEMALERVRSRTMAMQHSEELSKTASEMFNQIQTLGMQPWACGFNIFDKDEKTVTQWMSLADGGISPPFRTPLTEDPFFINIYNARQRSEELLVMESSGKELEDTYHYMFGLPDSGKIFGDIEKSGFPMPKFQITHCAYFSQGYLVFITYEPVPESWDVFKRFAKVFEQTYTRFLDLQKAEAQAREAQIQLALERVRARTMAMQKSDELPNAANLLFQQIQTLGMPAWSAGYCIWDEDKRAITLSMSSEGVLQPTLRMPLTEDPSLIHFREGYERGESLFVEAVGGEALREHYAYLRTLPGVKETLDDIEKAGFPVPTFQIFHLAYFTQGFLLFITYEPVPEGHEIFRRFAKVFEQTYTRFLDLKKAEAQAREAQIEAALERVRSRSMAMHKTNELQEVVRVVAEELKNTGVILDTWGAVICTYFQHSKDVIHWTASEDPANPSISFLLPYFKDELFDEAWASKNRGDSYFAKVFSFDVKNAFFNHAFKHSDYRQLPDDYKKLILESESHGIAWAWSKNSAIMIPSVQGDLPSEEEKEILIRFARVFEQSYIRFLDLQKAEAQAREAKIETALEKVRSRSLAMHKSEEIEEVLHTVFERLKELDIEFYTAIIILFNKDTKDIIWWLYSKENKLYPKILIPYGSTPYLRDLFEARENGSEQFSKTYSFGEKNEHYNYLFNHTDFKNVSEHQKKFLLETESASISVSLAKNTGIHITRYTGKSFSEQDNEIFKRFARVFEQAYTRFLDLQKAEAQAREAQIEAALERVRSRAMAMHAAGELIEVANVLREQMAMLGQPELETMAVHLYKDDSEYFESWYAFRAGDNPEEKIFTGTAIFKRDSCEVTRDFVKDYYSGKKEYTVEVSGAKREEWLKILANDAPVVVESFYERFDIVPEKTYFHCTDFSGGSMVMVSYQPPSEESCDLQRRATTVFDLAYRRFLDLKNAEAQAREAQIEAALERVRSRSMGMQKSEELKEVIQIVYEQFIHLNIHIEHTGFIMDYKERNDMLIWLADQHGAPSQVTIPYFDSPHWNSFIEAKDKGLDFFVNHLSFEEKNKFYQELFTLIPGVPEEALKFYLSCPGLAISTVLLENVGLYIENFSGTPYSDEDNNTLMRFGKVFQQTYTRFLDLQKAEAQAKESQIEAALERVRSRTMAMHKSDELLDIIIVVSEQLQYINIKFGNVSFGVNNPNYDLQLWMAVKGYPKAYQIHWTFLDNPGVTKLKQAQQQPENVYADVLTQSENNEWLQHIFNCNPGLDIFSEEAQTRLLNSPGYARSIVVMKDIFLVMGNYAAVPYTDDENAILKRFATVFEQAYKRFLDLKKAEAQAREAQIEAALERVRAKVMAMNNSKELNDTSLVFGEQLRRLGIDWKFSYFWLINESRNENTFWITWPDYKTSLTTYTLAEAEEYFNDCIISWRAGVKIHDNYVPPESVQQWLDTYQRITDDAGGEAKNVMRAEIFPEGVFYYDAMMKYGSFGICIQKPATDEEKNIQCRFAVEFERAYTRFNDLKNAEALALETQKRASVDRVRAEIASMRTTSDLERITPLIWNELSTLGVPFIRCGVFIMDEEKKEVQTMLSTPDGKAIATMHVPFDFDLSIITNGVDYWRKKQIYKEYWDAAAFNKVWIQLSSLRETIVDSPQTGHAPENLHLHMLPFLQGMLYVGSEAPLNEDELQLVQNLADAFSTAYARYEDFNKLEAAKNQVDSTLNELQATQKQLIQSEKMASLGELTAGIAHEIQNPLNFVNNFSEISVELIEEAEALLASHGGGQEAEENSPLVSELLTDIKENLEKINHHGKRADSIVKGMLQHSRSSSTIKEAIDINALADEYMRLAYHGLRAKDKGLPAGQAGFNATLKTDFDETIGKVNVIPQDIGRLLLNIYNNAFYAVHEKKKRLGDEFEPLVFVSTKKIDNVIHISVRDNGNGIPQKVVDKIFQPFFTTKPTGQGTGLGLSLAYDIVKAHNGELKVDSVEGQGSEFLIIIKETK